MSSTSAVLEVPEIDTLIVVCGHAIYLGGPGGVSEEKNWLIEPFQSGETSTFTDHIREGIKLLAESNGRAILAFSGGSTKQKRIIDMKNQGLLVPETDERRTEAESYEDVAVAEKYFGHDTQMSRPLRSRIFQEKFATDSYQNVLLALLQYPIWLEKSEGRTNSISDTTAVDNLSQNIEKIDAIRCPKRLVIVSHEFKRARFLDLHLPAIKTLLASLQPAKDTKGTLAASQQRTNFEEFETVYIGINPPFDAQKMKEIEEGDRKRGFGVWKEDIHGSGELLRSKRLDRGWDEKQFIQEVQLWYRDNIVDEITSIVQGHSVA